MNQIAQLHRLAQQAVNNRDFVKGHSYCVEIIKQNPQHADSYFLLAMINVAVGQITKAIKLIHKALEIDTTAEYMAHLCKCYALQGKIAEVCKYAELAPVKNIENPLTLDTLGVALSHIGLHQKALLYFAKALTLNTKRPEFYYNFAVSSKFVGHFAQAREAFEAAIRLKAEYFQAHFALADLGGIDKDNNHIKRLESLFNQSIHPNNLLHIGHALAKEYEALGEYDKSFEALHQAKQAKLAISHYQFSHDKELFEHLQKTQDLTRSNNQGYDSERPIFVLGMPRSGTTLVERILSNHTDVTSCGELQDFALAVKQVTATASQTVLDLETLEAAQNVDYAEIGRRYIQSTAEVSGSSKYFIDKLPFNFFYIDLIRKALPKAKIICLLRNPMDTCIGNFRQLFSNTSPYYQYTYDLSTIGHFYAEFYQLAHRWAKLKPDNFMLLKYEDLVMQPQTHIQQLLAFCQLPWQEKCLHVEQNQAPVATASKVQVRQPINTHSIGSWKKFSRHTQDLENILRDANIPVE